MRILRNLSCRLTNTTPRASCMYVFDYTDTYSYRYIRIVHRAIFARCRNCLLYNLLCRPSHEPRLRFHIIFEWIWIHTAYIIFICISLHCKQYARSDKHFVRWNLICLFGKTELKYNRNRNRSPAEPGVA